MLSKYIFAIVLLVFSLTCSCQTSQWENIFIDNYFEVAIENINNHLKSVLTKKEKKILDQIKIVIDTSENSKATAYSNSDNRTITLGSDLIRFIVRVNVAKIIDYIPDGERKRFSGVYLTHFLHLNNQILPEDAAMLNEDEKELLDDILGQNEFYGELLKGLMFIYIHELGHQVQNYSKQIIKLDKRLSRNKISLEEYKRELLFLEVQADLFAYDKIARMDVNPIESSEDMLSLFMLFKETRFATNDEITDRILNMLDFSKNAFCHTATENKLCEYIDSRYSDFIKLKGNYLLNHHSDSLKTMEKKAISDKNIYSIYNLGDLYLRGSSRHKKDLEKALNFYKAGAELNTDCEDLFGASSCDNLRGTIEFCQLICGKIYEWKKRDYETAIYYYEKAQKIGYFLPGEFYNRKIEKLKKE